MYVQDPIVMKKDDDNRSWKFFESFVSHEIQLLNLFLNLLASPTGRDTATACAN